jgi:hypothetical protein
LVIRGSETIRKQNVDIAGDSPASGFVPLLQVRSGDRLVMRATKRTLHESCLSDKS